MLSVEYIGLYILLGGFTGFMAGLLGVSGGGILVPLLTTIFTWQGMAESRTVHMALGTALTCMLLTSISSIRAHHIQGFVVWPIVGRMAAGIMAGAFITAQFAAQVSALYIAIFFSIFMLFVAVQMFANWKPAPNTKSPMTRTELTGTGLGIGGISALAAVGGGFLTIAYLGYKNISMKKAVGTSAAIGLPIAAAGAIGYTISGWSSTTETPYTLGYIYIPAFVAVSLSSILAAPLGARCSHSLPEIQLKRIFGIVCVLLSIKMLVSFVGQ